MISWSYCFLLQVMYPNSSSFCLWSRTVLTGISISMATALSFHSWTIPSSQVVMSMMCRNNQIHSPIFWRCFASLERPHFTLIHCFFITKNSSCIVQRRVCSGHGVGAFRSMSLSVYDNFFAVGSVTSIRLDTFEGAVETSRFSSDLFSLR